MTDFCASTVLTPRDAMRLPFGVGYVVLHRGAGFFAVLLHAARWPARVLAARRTAALLAAMDGRQLADIGLTRADVIEAADETLRANVGAFLTLRAYERATRALHAGAR